MKKPEEALTSLQVSSLPRRLQSREPDHRAVTFRKKKKREREKKNGIFTWGMRGCQLT